MARVVAEVDGQGGGRDWWPGCWPRLVARWWPRLLARVRSRLLARMVAKVVGQVAARVAAGVWAGVAPPVCRSGSGGTQHCEEKKVLKYNFKKML